MDTITVTGCESAHYEPLTRVVRMVRPSDTPRVKMDVQGLKVSVFFSCLQRRGAGKFVYDMIAKWLLPTKRLSIGLFFASDFTYEAKKWTAGELSFMLDSTRDITLAKSNFRRLAKELELGLSEPFFANRILELKGLSGAEKLSAVQDRLAHLIQRFPISESVLLVLQAYARSVSKMVIAERSVTTLVRLMLQMDRFSKVEGVKFLPQLIDTPLGFRYTLAAVIGKKTSDGELFVKKHALEALKAIFPKCFDVELAHFSQGQMHYIEIEKKQGGPFSLAEIKRAYAQFPKKVESALERLVHPINLVRNEEEVMRNLITLSKEIKFVRDLPQVMITFEKQDVDTLTFSILMVSLTKHEIPDFEVQRIREMDQLRGSHAKYAFVMRKTVPSAEFLRSDHVIDIFAARGAVSTLLEKAIGDFRDFNGGILAREQENFEMLCKLCPRKPRKDIETFFHALEPATLRSILSPQELKQRLT